MCDSPAQPPRDSRERPLSRLAPGPPQKSPLTSAASPAPASLGGLATRALPPLGCAPPGKAGCVVGVGRARFRPDRSVRVPSLGLSVSGDAAICAEAERVLRGAVTGTQ